MDFSISKEQKAYVQEVVVFARNEMNEDGTLELFSKNIWKKIADSGILGICEEEKFGGMGESYLTAALIFEAMGYVCKNNGLIFAITNHVWVAQHVISLYGTESARHKFLPRMISGELIGAIAISEPEAGSDALNMSTTAKKVEKGYIINGTKTFISNGPISDVFIVFAIDADKEGHPVSAFIVEREDPTVLTGEEIPKMGLNACLTSELILNNAFIPEENVLGAIGSGTSVMMDALGLERCYEFAPHIGAMKRVMEMSLDHSKKRVQFGKPIGEFQAISHKIADMKSRIELSKLMLYKIAWLRDRKRTSFMESSVFKNYVSESYIQTCRDAMQIFGAYGYSKEYDLERELRDALASSIYSGTNEMQKNTIYNML